MNIGNLLGQFAPMMGMLRSGGNPMSMISQMMGNDSSMSRAMQEATKAMQGRDAQAIENYVKEEFRKAGLDIQEVRRALGI